MSLARGSTSLLLRNRQRLSCFHDNGAVTHRIDLSTISISQHAIRNMPSSLSLSRQYDRCSSPVTLDSYDNTTVVQTNHEGRAFQAIESDG